MDWPFSAGPPLPPCPPVGVRPAASGAPVEFRAPTGLQHLTVARQATTTTRRTLLRLPSSKFRPCRTRAALQRPIHAALVALVPRDGIVSATVRRRSAQRRSRDRRTSR